MFVMLGLRSLSAHPDKRTCVPRDTAVPPFSMQQAKKVAVAGGDASIRIIDIVEERTVDVY